MSGPPTGWNPEQRYITSDGEPPSAPAAAFIAPPPPPYTAQPVPGRGMVLAVVPYPQQFAQFMPTWPPRAIPVASPPPAQPASPPRIPGNAPRFPPGLHPQAGNTMPRGVNYLFPSKHTMLHVFHKGIVPYDRPGQEMKFNIQFAPCSITVRELIDLLGVGDGASYRCGVSECLELGDGEWSKGITFFKSDDAAKQTLEEVGWDEERADKKMPVWLCLHHG